MALIRHKRAVATSALAAILMVAAPASAMPLNLPVKGYPSIAAHDDSYAHSRRYRGYRGHRDYRRDSGSGLLAGILILGGIAAIASAADNDRNQPVPPPPPYPEDWRYQQDQRVYDQGARSDGMNRAVDMCVAEVERTVAVAAVDGATRTGEGWFVSGEADSGSPWTCHIGNDGRISSVDVGDDYYSADIGWNDGPAASGGQYDDATYARMRASIGR